MAKQIDYSDRNIKSDRNIEQNKVLVFAFGRYFILHNNIDQFQNIRKFRYKHKVCSYIREPYMMILPEDYDLDCDMINDHDSEKEKSRKLLIKKTKEKRRKYKNDLWIHHKINNEYIIDSQNVKIYFKDFKF